MPFGIKNPSSFVRSGYVTGSYDGCCQGCGLVTSHVAPVKFPLTDSGIHESQTHLVCGNCYRVQGRLNYPTIEDFKGRSGRAAGPARVRVKKPVKQAAAVVLDEIMTGQPNSENLKNLLKLLESVQFYVKTLTGDETLVIKAKLDEFSKSLVGIPVSVQVEPVSIEPVSIEQESLEFAGDDPDFDIDFAMTPEQRRAMDEAFNRRASRSS